MKLVESYSKFRLVCDFGLGDGRNLLCVEVKSFSIKTSCASLVCLKRFM